MYDFLGQNMEFWEFGCFDSAVWAAIGDLTGSSELVFWCFSALDSKASNLSSLSKKYRHDAKLLNSRSAYAKAAATSLFFVVLMLYIRFWWLV